MAKKKPDIQEETPKEETPPLDYQKDIHNADLGDIASEWAESADEEESIPQDTPKEEPKEEIKEEPKPEIKEDKLTPPAIDEEKLTESIANKLIDKFAPADTVTKEEKKDLKTKLNDLANKAKEEGRDLTWLEASEFLHNETKDSVKEELKDIVKREVMDDLEKEAKDSEERETKAKAQTEAQNKVLTDQWDRQFSILESKEFLPKVVNPNDANDEGVKSQLNLLTQMQEYNIKNPKSPMMNAVEFYHSPNYQSPKTVPGANQPVAGARRSMTPSSDKAGYSYQDIHNKSIEDLLTQ